MSFRKRIFGDPDKPKKKPRFSLNPLHHHQGPFNSVDDEQPDDPIDKIGWKHDNLYGNAQENTGSFLAPYISNGIADDIHIQESKEEFSRSHNPMALVYASPFIIKHHVPLPRLPNEAFVRGRWILDPPRPLPPPPMLMLAPPVEAMAVDNNRSGRSRKSFNKMPGGRDNRRTRRGKKRSRKQKPMKRLTRLAIAKVSGLRCDYKRSDYQQLRGFWHTLGTGAGANNEYIFSVATMNDFYHYYDTANTNAGPSDNADLDFPTNTSYDSYHMTYAKTKLTLTNMGNCDLVLTPIRVTLKQDLYNETSLASFPESQMSLVAYNIFNVWKLIAANVQNTTAYAEFIAPVRGFHGASPFNPAYIEFPSGQNLPWKEIRKWCDVSFGADTLLPVESHRVVMCKGRKGPMPKAQFLATTPSDSTYVGTARTPVGFAKKTVVYMYKVRQASHTTSSLVATTDADEAYMGGPFRIAVDSCRTTQGVNLTGTQLGRHLTNFVDNRPQPASGATPYAWVDTDQDQQPVVPAT